MSTTTLPKSGDSERDVADGKAKRTYASPTLKVLGTVADLTAGAPGTKDDGGTPKP